MDRWTLTVSLPGVDSHRQCWPREHEEAVTGQLPKSWHPHAQKQCSFQTLHLGQSHSTFCGVKGVRTQKRKVRRLLWWNFLHIHSTPEIGKKHCSPIGCECTDMQECGMLQEKTEYRQINLKQSAYKQMQLRMRLSWVTSKVAVMWTECCVLKIHVLKAYPFR